MERIENYILCNILEKHLCHQQSFEDMIEHVVVVIVQHKVMAFLCLICFIENSIQLAHSILNFIIGEPRVLV